MADLRVRLGELEFKNPIIPASGTFGFGKEFSSLYDLNILGGISIKGTTVHEREGNDHPRIAECDAGLINCVGLQNPGIDHVCKEEIPALAEIYKGNIIANISGFSVEEYVRCAGLAGSLEEVDILEVNISCPNVHGGGLAFGQDKKQAQTVTEAVRKVTDKPVYIKLSPNVTDVAEIARACEAGGADGISLVNTFLAMRIDVKNRCTITANKMGGYSGPGIFPVALRMVNQVAKAVSVPVMGMGGIDSAEKVLEMIMAGAHAVQIGAYNLVDPWACPKIIEDLERLMNQLGINNLDEVRGIV